MVQMMNFPRSGNIKYKGIRSMARKEQAEVRDWNCEIRRNLGMWLSLYLMAHISFDFRFFVPASKARIDYQHAAATIYCNRKMNIRQ
jgi:hypothetical protein